MAANNVLIDPGSVTPIATDTSGTIQFQQVKINMGAATVDGSIFQGTVTNNMNSGTLNAGTVTVTGGSIVMTAGTARLDSRTTQNVLSYGTTVGLSGAGYGTLVGSASVGAGTSTWIQDFSIINPAGTATCLLGFGTVLNGTSVIFKGVLGTQTVGGIQKSFNKPVNCGMTNQDLVLYLSGAGTVDVSVSYFISA